ncbi:aldehyde dehydrogenase family protein [Kordiimonas lacus]|uniref:Acyl-CoA reductase n=1 Tax=Kordiimonas lacus TaxID=637679 RepID=A0A1G7EUC0_9PROT|nr:aldehyde dehydrogenase family protein [Kordiimonas lacus]SDE67300.1 Acyl-CoA reductase [Kordiimonas lacus]
MSVKTVSPIDGQIVIERPYIEKEQAFACIDGAGIAQTAWASVPVKERVRLLENAIDYMVVQADDLAREITLQMGRPISQTPGEIAGMAGRARYMLSIAEEALAGLSCEAPEGQHHFIRRAPLGVVLVVSPWNYPYLTAVNVIIPALAAGNAVVLKPSAQTPLIGERFAEAFDAAGLPAGLFQCLHLSRETTTAVVREADIHHVAFTGSVGGGAQMETAAAGRFLSMGLELGGKDAAYVRADADIQAAAEGLVDGAMFNSGQSCCGIERIYVAAERYDEFVEACATIAKGYRLGNPLDPTTTLGPVVNVQAAEHIRSEIAKAVSAGARPLVDETVFQVAKPGTPYVAPQILVDVDHSMSIMTEETFGPVVGVMPVEDDDAAIKLMNDSPYGLTASIWSCDEAAALKIADKLEVGTVFMNRCDALEPALAWAGVKDTGKGCTLSRYGYDALTRPKSFNFKYS